MTDTPNNTTPTSSTGPPPTQEQGAGSLVGELTARQRYALDRRKETFGNVSYQWDGEAAGFYHAIQIARKHEQAWTQERDDLRNLLQAFVTFHSGHVLPPELQEAMNGARAVLARARGEEGEEARG